MIPCRRTLESDTQTRTYRTKHQSRIIACESIGEGYAIELQETIFYPEGGGQPADKGWIQGVPVQDVQKSTGRILHFIKVPLPLGEAEMEIDCERISLPCKFPVEMVVTCRI